MHKQLNYDQRCTIKKLLDSDTPIPAISKTLGVHRSSIYREISRNSKPDGIYDPDYAQSQYEKGLNKNHPRLSTDTKTANFIADKIINEHLSPERIATIISNDNSLFPAQKISTNTIYNAIDSGLIPGVNRESLNSRTTVMFSDGLLRLPKWVMQQTGFSDGDKFEIDISIDNQITFRKCN